MHDSKNILVVGAGIAGSLISALSVKAGYQVVMYDQFVHNSASQTAAGLFNVMTGKVAKKTIDAEEMLESLIGFFDEPAFQSLKHNLHLMPIYRPFESGQNYNDWMAKITQSDYAALARHQSSPILEDQIQNPIGGLEVTTCGWVDTVGLCRDLIELLEKTGKFRREQRKFDYELLDPETGKYALEPTAFDEIIFCEGIWIKDNPWFDFIDLRPLKGQVLELNFSETIPTEFILNKQAFLIPKDKNNCTAGSTYELQYEDDQPSEEGINSIAESVSRAISRPFKVSSARAALRPTSPNRRPILGRHPEHNRLIVFNGLGTKGVLQGPYYAKMLRNWLDGSLETLPNDIGLLRFLKKNV